MYNNAKEAFANMFPNLWAKVINSGTAGDSFFVTLNNHQILYFEYVSNTTWTLSTKEPK